MASIELTQYKLVRCGTPWVLRTHVTRAASPILQWWAFVGRSRVANVIVASLWLFLCQGSDLRVSAQCASVPIERTRKQRQQEIQQRCNRSRWPG